MYLKLLSSSVGPMFSISCNVQASRGFLALTQLLASALSPAFSELLKDTGVRQLSHILKMEWSKLVYKDGADWAHNFEGIQWVLETICKTFLS